MDDTLASIVLMLKNLCFNVVTVLTVLVALGNELKRLRMTYKWLEERRAELEKAWKISLGVYLSLSALYAGLKHEPAALVMDVLVIGLMVYAVHWLRKRGPDAPSPLAPRPGSMEDEESFNPRRPLRTRRERGPVKPEGELRQRRERRAEEPESELRPRRRRREYDDRYNEDPPPLE